MLNPKCKGKIGILDPRSAGAGTATWSFFLKIKGEEFLKKLAAQDMLLSRDQRQLADNLAKGKINLTIGLSYYTFAPFLKAGLPIKSLPEAKEGTYTSCGSGALSIVKNSPHPNATKIFINWLLSKEGQEVYGKAMGQATRRLDIDTKWLLEYGTKASKDFLTVEQNDRLENYGEETIKNYWARATKIAEEVLR
jgi:ABC-type Fe3+ transport system substrate-binding protein